MRSLLISIAFLLLAAAAYVPGLATRSYRIEPGSVLRLEGKTNVGGFRCTCEDQFKPQTFTARAGRQANFAEFSATTLDVRTRSLDCGNKLMNRDLYKALNAEKYPNIRIELLRVVENECSMLQACEGEWVEMKVQMRITLNGCSNDYWLDATGKKFSDTKFRFKGAKSLCMSEFGVTPPTAVMGTVKVQDEIRILFDLAVVVE